VFSVFNDTNGQKRIYLSVTSDDVVKPVRCVRNLGIYLDSDVSMRTHISRTVSSCFAALCQIRSIQRSVHRPVLLSLVTSLILSRLDYGSMTLAGVPGYLLDRLQSVLHASARLVNRARKHDPVSSLLWDLHWLRVPERIKYRLAVLVYRCHIHTAPEYLVRDLHWVADDDSRRRLRSSTTQQLKVPRTRLRTVGDRAFQVAGPRVWNALPASVVSAPSLTVFKSHLKMHLFQQQSYRHSH